MKNSCLVLSVLISNELIVSAHKSLDSAMKQAKDLLKVNHKKSALIRDKITTLFCDGVLRDNGNTFYLSYCSIEDVTN